jgi:hypothetical protein
MRRTLHWKDWLYRIRNGISATKTFYAASSSGGPATQLNTITTAFGSITGHTQSGGGGSAYITEISAQRQNTTITGTGDQVAATIAIPGGTLGTNKGLRVTGVIRRTTGSGTLVVKVKYGGSTVSGTTLSATGGNIVFVAYVWGDGATNAQRGGIVTTYNGSNLVAVGTSAVDSTASQNLTIEGLLGTTTDVWTLDYAAVEAL